ncbi:ATP-dependent RNA helicase DDX51 [Hypsibius exemplaris]|uniref:ATP-dependent RNA helicase DDX51 n=1 Tax=Hypsibius exemplaris TaxID=2072580 RepID=A0A1W0WDK9_HYPEX|nr:ATP-dependent RNA helicase DDX51 [Hypsibius exemplaris]
MEVDAAPANLAAQSQSQRRRSRKRLRNEQDPRKSGAEVLEAATEQGNGVREFSAEEVPDFDILGIDTTTSQSAKPGSDGSSNARPSKKAKRARKTAARTAAVSDVWKGVPDVPVETGSLSSAVPVPETGFTVIGHAKQAKKIKLPPYLPAWYSAPLPISTDLNSGAAVDAMPGLDIHFAAVLREQGIDRFFPVQQTIIPHILGYQNYQRYYTRRPPDLCVCAPTGSGKTLAYAVPILQDLSKRTTCAVRALILVPVKELAVQVAETFQTFAKGTRVKVGLICGKVSLEQERQQILEIDPISAYKNYQLDSTPKKPAQSSVDVLIATPGRLVDHLYETADLDLQHLEYLVVDEADRMIEEFKNNWFRLLERAIFKNPHIRPALDYTCSAHYDRPTLPLQKLLFSATLSYDPQRFETLKLYRPKLFAALPGSTEIDDVMMRNDAEVIGSYVTPDALKEMSILVDPRLKPLVILHLLHNLGWRKVLIFTNSLESTHRLYHLIRLFKGKSPVVAHEISSIVHQRKRQASLDSFEKGKVDVLVASDSVARGIDLPNVEYVVLYDAPLHAKTYIHRSGRTARAGKPGTALTMLKPNEKKMYDKIMKELNKKHPAKMALPPDQLGVLEEGYKIALVLLEAALQEGAKHA